MRNEPTEDGSLSTGTKAASCGSCSGYQVKTGEERRGDGESTKVVGLPAAVNM